VPGLAGRAAGAALAVGFGMLTIAEAGWAHTIGIVALLVFLPLGFLAVVPGLLDDEGGGEGGGQAAAGGSVVP